MHKSTEKVFESVIEKVSSITEVKSIGISGAKSQLPAAGEGDIDFFIYCDEIPDIEKRKKILSNLDTEICNIKMNIFEGGHWGTGDFIEINGVETWLMFFKITDVIRNIDEILSGKYPDKIDNYYYPIGRVGMLEKITILYDKNEFLKSLKEKLRIYPEALLKKLIDYHIDKLSDMEDIERAVYRKDVLFYHFALDIAIDHFLQAIFALNKTYFPSRKRSLSFINIFEIKPNYCGERILDIIQLGSQESNMKTSYELLLSLISELIELSKM
ncbi:MAG: hypothetical protein K0R50_3318 [Eubacterium sp.]|nr:hypothetical protein [Eubacterium sp.]